MSTRSTQVQKVSRLIGPYSTNGAAILDRRRPATKVVVFGGHAKRDSATARRVVSVRGWGASWSWYRSRRRTRDWRGRGGLALKPRLAAIFPSRRPCSVP